MVSVILIFTSIFEYLELVAGAGFATKRYPTFIYLTRFNYNFFYRSFKVGKFFVISSSYNHLKNSNWPQ